MRLRTYDSEGKPIWGPNTPASTGSSRLGGELVVGYTPRKTTQADLTSSQLYRQRHPDRVADYQRQYRAKVRAEVTELREQAS